MITVVAIKTTKTLVIIIPGIAINKTERKKNLKVCTRTWM